ncbi:MAG: acetyl-CoA carboxylase biotin carboxyl carrier protein [Chlamydiia bacterium]|nr:acetyl-CoA carboxylase biotin carboxyl carrier protein [Chlamydiia bacterium]
MDLKQIEKLMAAMGRNEIKRVVLKKEGFELELEKEVSTNVPMSSSVAADFQLEPSFQQQEIVSNPSIKGGCFITSPMVGTFYTSSSPNDPPYIKVGDKVDSGTLVCIIEAMKVMNEVKAGMNGEIAEILVNNGDPVEFGTQIFRVV